MNWFGKGRETSQPPASWPPEASTDPPREYQPPRVLRVVATTELGLARDLASQFGLRLEVQADQPGERYSLLDNSNGGAKQTLQPGEVVIAVYQRIDPRTDSPNSLDPFWKEFDARRLASQEITVSSSPQE